MLEERLVEGAEVWERGLWWCEHSRLAMVKHGGSCVFASGLLVAWYRCKKGGIRFMQDWGGGDAG